MHCASILHRPMSEYAFPLDERHLVFRLRTAREDLAEVTFFYGDRADMAAELTFVSLEMPRVRRDKLYDWYELTLETEWPRIAYGFLLDDGTETCSYCGGAFERADARIERSSYFQYPYNHKADLFRVPSWARDAVVYNIFPDSFADGHRQLCGPGRTKAWKGDSCEAHLGGTIEGIRKNLDAIAQLGCNCLYLNPLFAAGAYHKYDLLDYEHVDPCFGTDEEFAALVSQAHSLGIRVIIDGVFNHMSWHHPAFRDVLARGKESPYYGWFYDLPDPLTLPEEGETPGYACFAYVPQMPKTDTSNESLRQYFCRVGVHWIREYHVDGWRLDVANELDDGFLRAFRSAVKRENPDALIIGEVWENAEHYMHGDMLDSAMNYDFRRFCIQFFAEGRMDAEEFDLRISSLLMRYPSQALPSQLNLLDGHDVPRFLSLCGEDPDRMEAALLFQMTFPGMPCVFYGDERGMTGVQEAEYRRPMAWEKTSPLEAVYRKLIRLRHDHPALRRGAFSTQKAEGRTYDYALSGEGETIQVVLNLGLKAIELRPHGKILLQKGYDEALLQPMGYCVVERE